MTRKGSGFMDAAYQILKEAGHPMHVYEIAKISLDRGLVTSYAENPVHSLVGTLYSEVERRPNIRGFRFLGKGIFGLAEWGEQTTAAPSTPTRRRHSSGLVEPTPLLGITLEKLERIRQVMSADEFRHDWGEIYDQLLAVERANAITPVNDRHLLDRVWPVVQRIQDFLQGHGNDSPKSEVVCDWIYLCYTLELHREGAAL